MAIGRAYRQCLTGLISMARGTETIQERLATAFLDHLRHIDPQEDLPPALEQQFLELKEMVTTHEPEREGESRVAATTRAMSASQAQEVADAFIAFATNVATAYHEEEGTRQSKNAAAGRDAA